MRRIAKNDTTDVLTTDTRPIPSLLCVEFTALFRGEGGGRPLCCYVTAAAYYGPGFARVRTPSAQQQVSVPPSPEHRYIGKDVPPRSKALFFWPPRPDALLCRPPDLGRDTWPPPLCLCLAAPDTVLLKNLDPLL